MCSSIRCPQNPLRNGCLLQIDTYTHSNKQVCLFKGLFRSSIVNKEQQARSRNSRLFHWNLQLGPTLLSPNLTLSEKPPKIQAPSPKLLAAETLPYRVFKSPPLDQPCDFFCPPFISGMLEISPWSVWSNKPGLLRFILIWLTALAEKLTIREQKTY